MSAQPIWLPICPVCHQPVALEEAKTDEDGAATHEACYVRKLREKDRAVKPTPIKE